MIASRPVGFARVVLRANLALQCNPAGSASAHARDPWLFGLFIPFEDAEAHCCLEPWPRRTMVLVREMR